jgi:hypothetical protein
MNCFRITAARAQYRKPRGADAIKARQFPELVERQPPAQGFSPIQQRPEALASFLVTGVQAQSLP